MPGAAEDVWMPEPELREPTPRRVVPSEYPDLNRPNVVLLCTIGAVAVVIGIVLFVLGISGKNSLFTIAGVVLCLGGGAVLAIFPQKQKAHLTRAEHLVMNGVPVMARILGANNMTGDSTHGRSVKYQVTLPGGDLAHRDVNADDRALPRRIPCNATALLDVKTGDAELYCALPFRAVPKTSPATGAAGAAAPAYPTGPLPTAAPGALADLPTAQPAGNAGPGRMGTIGDHAQPTPQSPQPAPTANRQPQPQPQPAKPDSQGLPWE